MLDDAISCFWFFVFCFQETRGNEMRTKSDWWGIVVTFL